MGEKQMISEEPKQMLRDSQIKIILQEKENPQTISPGACFQLCVPG